MYQRQTLFHRLADLKTKKKTNLENQKKAEKVLKKQERLHFKKQSKSLRLK